MMRKLPIYLTAIILACTIDRVAHFFNAYMGSNLPQAWGFSISIAAGVWVCSYLTREHVTAKEKIKTKASPKIPVKSRSVIISDEVRNQARRWMYTLIIADGIFNLSDVLMGLPIGTSTPIWIVACIYGSLPTVISAGLGSLQGAVDRLPTGAKRSIPVVSDLFSGLQTLARRWAADVKKPQRKAAVPAVAGIIAVVSTGSLFKCERCTWESDPARNEKQQQAQSAGHQSSHKRQDAKIV